MKNVEKKKSEEGSEQIGHKHMSMIVMNWGEKYFGV